MGAAQRLTAMLRRALMTAYRKPDA